MACGGKITKGGGMVVAIPFDATDVENLVVSVYTNGDEKIEKSGDDIRIGEGIIYVDMSKTDVDLLADGVVSYTMDYEIDGVQYSESGGTTNYIKTPKDYSATSITEVVQSAYTEGHAQGKQEGEEVGYNDAVSAIRNQSISLSVSANGVYTANTQDSIYFNEVNVNVPHGSGSSCNLQAKSQSIDGSGTGLWNIYPDAGYDGMESVTILDKGYGEAKYVEGHAQGKYEGYESGHYDGMIEGFESGYTAGQADCPECSGGTSCNLQSGNLSLPPEGVGIWTLYPEEGYDGFSYFQVVDNGYAESYWEQGYGSGFESGYTAGQADCSGGTSCDLTETWIDLMEGDDFEGQGVDYYVSAITPNYDGWYKVHIQDKGYGYSKFNEGYREFQNGLTSFSFGPEQIVASGNGSFTYTNASGWSSVTIGMPLVYSCRVIFANMSGLLNILSASDVTDIRFGYDALTQSEVIVGHDDITIYGTPTYGTGRFEGIRFAIPTSIFNQISSWDASALSLNGFKSNLNQYIGGIVFTPYRTTTWQSGDKTFISVSTFNFDN